MFGASKLLILRNSNVRSKLCRKRFHNYIRSALEEAKKKCDNKMAVDDFTDSHIRLGVSYTVGKRGRGRVRCRRDRSNDSSRDNNTIGDSI